MIKPKNIIKCLKKNRIKWIFSLCSENEVNVEVNYEENFCCKRIVLPDHKYKEDLTIDKLNLAINTLAEIMEIGPVYIHCVAGIERSPLVCMAWLVKNYDLTPTQSLEYIINVNKVKQMIKKIFFLFSSNAIIFLLK